MAKLIIEYCRLASLRHIFVSCVCYSENMSERPDGCRLLTLQAIAPYVCVGTGIFHGRNKSASKMLPVCAMLKKESTRNEYFF